MGTSIPISGITSVSPSISEAATNSSPLRVNMVAPMVFCSRITVSLDRQRRLILAQFLQAIRAFHVWADHFENNHGIIDRLGAWIEGGAGNENIGIAGASGDKDLHLRAKRPAWAAPQPRSERPAQIEGNKIMTDSPAGHRHRLEPVELIPQLLAPRLVQELGQGHRIPQRDVHDLDNIPSWSPDKGTLADVNQLRLRLLHLRQC
jgi:hypothetical protein